MRPRLTRRYARVLTSVLLESHHASFTCSNLARVVHWHCISTLQRDVSRCRWATPVRPSAEGGNTLCLRRIWVGSRTLSMSTSDYPDRLAAIQNRLAMPILKDATCVAHFLDTCLCNACGIFEVGLALLDCSEIAHLPSDWLLPLSKLTEDRASTTCTPTRYLTRTAGHAASYLHSPARTAVSSTASNAEQLGFLLAPAKLTLIQIDIDGKHNAVLMQAAPVALGHCMQQVLRGSRQDCVCHQHQSQSLGLCWD